MSDLRAAAERTGVILSRIITIGNKVGRHTFDPSGRGNGVEQCPDHQTQKVSAVPCLDAPVSCGFGGTRPTRMARLHPGRGGSVSAWFVGHRFRQSRRQSDQRNSDFGKV